MDFTIFLDSNYLLSYYQKEMKNNKKQVETDAKSINAG
jgi:hypothetical protein